MQSFYDKSHFYFLFKQFSIKEKSKPILEKIEKISCKANALAISTIYTTVRHFDLISVLNNIIDFTFKGGSKKYIDFSGNIAVWCHKLKSFIFP